MSLRAQILRGGYYLAFRQGVGMVIGLLGSVCVARIVGPKTYGLYAGTINIYNYVWFLSQWGINVYLIRRVLEPAEEDYHQATSLLMVMGLAGGVLGFASLPVLRVWLHVDSVVAVGFALLLALPVHLTNFVPMARLERTMDYRSVAMVELAGQLAYYAAALPLACLGAGVWAMVGGFWLQLVTNTAMLYPLARYRPRWLFRRALVAEMAGYGFGFASAGWIWQLRSLINPLIVGRYAGTEAVGFIALAIRLVDTLSFVKNATWRISLAALAKMQGNGERLAQAISHGMWLQLLAVGPCLVLFAWAAPVVLPLFYGEHWRPALPIYPYIALGCLINAGFNLHASTLAVLGRNLRAAVIAGILVTVFACAAVLLVKRIGYLGYGWAELIMIPVYASYHWAIRAEVGPISYTRSLVWWLAFGIGLFTQSLGWWVILAPLSLLLFPSTWKSLREIWFLVRPNR